MLKPSRAMEENYLPARIYARLWSTTQPARKVYPQGGTDRLPAVNQCMVWKLGLCSIVLFSLCSIVLFSGGHFTKKNLEANLGCHRMTTLCRWTLQFCKFCCFKVHAIFGFIHSRCTYIQFMVEKLLSQLCYTLMVRRSKIIGGGGAPHSVRHCFCSCLCRVVDGETRTQPAPNERGRGLMHGPGRTPPPRGYASG